MDPAVRELAELVGRVLAEHWVKRQKEKDKITKPRREPSPSAGKHTTEKDTSKESEHIP